MSQASCLFQKLPNTDILCINSILNNKQHFSNTILCKKQKKLFYLEKKEKSLSLQVRGNK